MRSWKLAISSTIVVASLLVNAAPLVAQTGDGPPADVPDGMEWTPSGGLTSDVLEVDAAILAERFGWSTKTAEARLRAQLKMDDVVPVLLDTYPSFAGVYWNDGANVVAQFTKAAPADAVDLIRSTGATVTTVVVEFSASELEAIKQDVEVSLRSLAGDSGWVVGIAPRDNAIVVTLDARTGVTARQLRAALSERAQAAEVRIDVHDGPVVRPLTARGGADMRINNTFDCTSGFTVFTGSTTGVSTAGHCTNAINEFWDPFNSVGHNAPRQGGFVGSWGDFQWHTTSGSEVDDFFRNNNGAVRDVTGVKNSFAGGETITAYGRGGPGNDSGQIGYIGIDTGSTGRQVCTNQLIMTGGDSGGPVYQVGVAAGLVTSHAFVDGAWRFCFSQARFMDDAMGVSVMQ